MDLDALIRCLRSERGALEHLALTLEDERLVLVSGQHRRLREVTGAAEAAVAALASVSAERAALLAEAAGGLGLPAGATLRALAEAVPCPEQRQVLLDLRAQMRRVMTHIVGAAATNRQLLARGLAATTDALALLGAGSSYDASGSASLTSPERLGLLDARV